MSNYQLFFTHKCEEQRDMLVPISTVLVKLYGSHQFCSNCWTERP